MFLWDLALRLKDLGHDPRLFSLRCGALAEELRACGIQVYDSLDAIDFVPDILHCQHTFETLMLLNRYPTVPALYVCHDRTAWFDTPPPFKERLAYVTVSHFIRERFVESCGIALEESSVIYI